jgi:hypothetical protein
MCAKLYEHALVPDMTVRPGQGLEILFVYVATDSSPVLALVSDDEMFFLILISCICIY